MLNICRPPSKFTVLWLMGTNDGVVLFGKDDGAQGQVKVPKSKVKVRRRTTVSVEKSNGLRLSRAQN